MKVKAADTIELKIKELEERLRPSIRYNINNEEIGYTISDAISATIINAKIDALKWCIFKKRKI